MLQTILTITLILMLLLALIVLAACIVGGREDRVMEHMYEKWEQEHPEIKQQIEEMEG
jgi:ABC-type glycerol-3-phosphate transport system substrate-binding protein